MTPPGRMPARRDSGFTLIELLVSLAILALLAGMLLAGVQAVAMMTARTAASNGDLDRIAAAQMILRGRLTRLQSVSDGGSSDPVIDAQGDRSYFTFVGVPAAAVAPDGLYRYRLMLSAGGDLVLYAHNALDARADSDDDSMTGWTPNRLLRGVARMSITYFGDDRINGGRRWQNFWAQHPQPPDLVRVHIEFPAGDRRVWPDLVVRPRATVNSLCKIDRLSGRCRSDAA